MSRTPAIMFQGTGSNVGKSLIVAGLCRLFARMGVKVCPFKPQNMSNNAAATSDGGEIGRAQALQARAAGLETIVHMNPVLLKPETDRGAQVIVQGKRLTTLNARDYGKQKRELLTAVLESYRLLEDQSDLMIIEGAGSPAETNLRTGDIANMGFAEAADLPVVLIGDIDRGGVIASLVGTHAVLQPAEISRIKGYMINRFRGDTSLFDDGLAEISSRTGWKNLGIAPWFDAAAELPAEDSLGLVNGSAQFDKGIKVAVPKLPRIANFDDLDPLRLEPHIDLQIIEAPNPLPEDADLIILTGSKATIADLAFLRQTGWDIDIAAHVRRGGHVLGLCGGYQILGREISDPDGVEGLPGAVKGLSLLDITTQLTADKTTQPANGYHVESGRKVSGYEIHLGYSEGPDCIRPFLKIGDRMDGAQSADGYIVGTYMHGLLASDEFRTAYLESLGTVSSFAYEKRIDDILDALADHLEAHLDINGISNIAHRSHRR